MEFAFDRDLILRSSRYDRRWAVVKVVVLYAIAGALGALLLDATRDLFLGILLGGLVATLLIVVGASRLAARRVHDLWAQQSTDRRLRLELDEEGFTVRLGESASRHRWDGLRRLWRYPDVWMLEVVRMSSVVFPPEAASAEARAFVVERCRSAGART